MNTSSKLLQKIKEVIIGQIVQKDTSLQLSGCEVSYEKVASRKFRFYIKNSDGKVYYTRLLVDRFYLRLFRKTDMFELFTKDFKGKLNRRADGLSSYTPYEMNVLEEILAEVGITSTNIYTVKKINPIEVFQLFDDSLDYSNNPTWCKIRDEYVLGFTSNIGDIKFFGYANFLKALTDATYKLPEDSPTREFLINLIEAHRIEKDGIKHYDGCGIYFDFMALSGISGQILNEKEAM